MFGTYYYVVTRWKWRATEKDTFLADKWSGRLRGNLRGNLSYAKIQKETMSEVKETMLKQNETVLQKEIDQANSKRAETRNCSATDLSQ